MSKNEEKNEEIFGESSKMSEYEELKEYMLSGNGDGKQGKAITAISKIILKLVDIVLEIISIVLFVINFFTNNIFKLSVAIAVIAYIVTVISK